VPPVTLVEFGIARVAKYHYLMPLGVVPLLIIMNKQTFDNLPPAARDIMRQYSGEWLAKRFAEGYDASNKLALEQLQSDPKRFLLRPSQADLDAADNAFQSVIEKWTGADPRNREMLELLRREIVGLRTPAD